LDELAAGRDHAATLAFRLLTVNNFSRLGLRMSRAITTAIALTIVSTILFLLTAFAYWLGQTRSAELKFLDPLRAPTPFEAVMTYPMDYARNSSEANDVIFVGDSTCLRDIDPRQFERLTGLRAFNLGTIGPAGSSTLFIITRTYLAHHPAPRAIVVCMTPLAFGPVAEKDLVDLPVRFEESFGDSASAVAAVKIGSRTMCAAFAKKEHRDVRDLPLSGLKSMGEDAGTAETYRSLKSRLRDARGFWALPDMHEQPYFMPPWKGEPVEVKPEWEPRLAAIAEMCAQRKAQLVIRISPLRDNMKRTRDFAPFERWLSELASGHPEVTVCRPAMAWYEEADCWDYVHLNHLGVEKFTAVVAKDVQAALEEHKPLAASDYLSTVVER
jgi:hypothetical protein